RTQAAGLVRAAAVPRQPGHLSRPVDRRVAGRSAGWVGGVDITGADLPAAQGARRRGRRAAAAAGPPAWVLAARGRRRAGSAGVRAVGGRWPARAPARGCGPGRGAAAQGGVAVARPATGRPGVRTVRLVRDPAAGRVLPARGRGPDRGGTGARPARRALPRARAAGRRAFSARAAARAADARALPVWPPDRGAGYLPCRAFAARRRAGGRAGPAAPAAPTGSPQPGHGP